MEYFALKEQLHAVIQQPQQQQQKSEKSEWNKNNNWHVLKIRQ